MHIACVSHLDQYLDDDKSKTKKLENSSGMHTCSKQSTLSCLIYYVRINSVCKRFESLTALHKFPINVLLLLFSFVGCAIPTGAGKGKLEPAEDKAVYFVCRWCEWEVELLRVIE